MNNLETDEIGEEKSFAELMAETPVEREWLHPGQMVNAVIVKITPEWIFIDLGSKSEGYLDGKEFLNGEGNLTVKEGDTIRAYFLSSRNNEKLFTTRIGRGDAGKAHLENAWRNGIPVEGKIIKETKGGIEVAMAGDIRAFCPFSQTGLPRSENISEYFGKILSFKITEYSDNGRNIVISHRAILEEEKTKQKEELKEVFKEGMIVQGKVISIQNFGAFVDIGGIQGLLPLSEVGWNRAEEIKDVLAVGDELSLSILKLDWGADKITLSRKATLPDPWSNIEGGFPKGSCHSGRVTSLTDFGAFVTLETGVDGLLHISKLAKGKRIKHAGEVLAKGQTVEVRIETVDADKKRISLSLVDSEGEENEEKNDDYHKYLGSQANSLGSLGDILKGKAKVKTH
jgi:small subunit ribosomal protein S1